MAENKTCVSAEEAPEPSGEGTWVPSVQTIAQILAMRNVNLGKLHNCSQTGSINQKRKRIMLSPPTSRVKGTISGTLGTVLAGTKHSSMC